MKEREKKIEVVKTIIARLSIAHTHHSHSQRDYKNIVCIYLYIFESQIQIRMLIYLEIIYYRKSFETSRI